jgi:hypothetical protein
MFIQLIFSAGSNLGGFSRAVPLNWAKLSCCQWGSLICLGCQLGYWGQLLHVVTHHTAE